MYRSVRVHLLKRDIDRTLLRVGVDLKILPHHLRFGKKKTRGFALSVLSLCVSRACLGEKMAVLASNGIAKRDAFSSFLRHLYIKTIILPRQARDKHREDSKKMPFSLPRERTSRTPRGPATNAFLLNFCRVCPEPVLVKSSFSAQQWRVQHNKAVAFSLSAPAPLSGPRRSARTQSSYTQRRGLQKTTAPFFSTFPICPKPVLAK